MINRPLDGRQTDAADVEELALLACLERFAFGGWDSRTVIRDADLHQM